MTWRSKRMFSSTLPTQLFVLRWNCFFGYYLCHFWDLIFLRYGGTIVLHLGHTFPQRTLHICKKMAESEDHSLLSNGLHWLLFQSLMFEPLLHWAIKHTKKTFPSKLKEKCNVVTIHFEEAAFLLRRNKKGKKIVYFKGVRQYSPY